MTGYDDQILRVTTTHTDPGGLTVVAEGELDIASDEPLRVAIADAAVSARDVVLDLRGITFCGSSGIALILDARRALGDRLRLLVGAEVRRVFELTGLSRLLDGGGGPSDPAEPETRDGPDLEEAM